MPKQKIIAGLSILAIIISIVQAIRALPEREVATGCDAFGYLRSAEVIRTAFREGRQARFDVATPQTDLLVTELKRQQIPVSEWQFAVAPHAHHYIERSQRIALQYPPGTGLALSMFPKGYGVLGVTALAIGLIALVALLLAAKALRQGRSVTLIAVAVCATVWLATLERIGIRSFSINVLVVPLGIAIWLACQRRAALAGMVTGLCVLIRLPVALVAPGLAVAACRSRRDYLIFGITLMASGLVPLALYQWQYAGAPWSSTYGQGDAAGFSLSNFSAAIPFYLGIGLGSKLNWALLLTLPLALGRADRRAWIAAGLTLALGVAYFLTHSILIPYYLTPTILTVVGLLLFPLALTAPKLKQESARPQDLVALALCLLVWPIASFSPPTPQPPPLDPRVPAALLAEKSWVWADELSGTFLYEHGKSAFKPLTASPRVTQALFNFAAWRGERQFLVQDIGVTGDFMAALRSGTYGSFDLKPFGTAFGAPVFELVPTVAAR